MAGCVECQAEVVGNMKSSTRELKGNIQWPARKVLRKELNIDLVIRTWRAGRFSDRKVAWVMCGSFWVEVLAFLSGTKVPQP